jgi:hypothetical protein
MRTRSKARFNDQAAEGLNGAVIRTFNEPGTVNADLQVGAGVRVGRIGRTVYGFEASLPSVLRVLQRQN